MNGNAQELEELARRLALAAKGVGEDRKIEQISQQPISTDWRLLEIKKASYEVEGQLKDITIYERKLFGCGHLCLGKGNFGGICTSKHHRYRKLPVVNRKLDPNTPLVACKECLRACARCQRGFCLYCITLNSRSEWFCSWCARLCWLFPCLRRR
jgi:hypothetical protein